MGSNARARYVLAPRAAPEVEDDIVRSNNKRDLGIGRCPLRSSSGKTPSHLLEAIQREQTLLGT
jgi:hypothetical protein